jgi:SAM-dependent methyltransferase
VEDGIVRKRALLSGLTGPQVAVRRRQALDAWRASRKHGAWRALKIALSSAIDLSADARLGISTRGAVVTAQGLYLPSRMAPLRALLRSGAVPTGLRFVDVGCGKGRALAVAALCGFRCLEGIEYRADLLADAERNLASVAARTGGLDVRLLRADALEHEFEPSDQVFYLYDPFDQATTRAFFGRILGSWRENPREIHVVYHNNLLGDSCPGHEVFRGWRADTKEFLGNRFFVFRSPR